ncbi:hypothetical protein QYF36_025975 [Acer negundo]|nr:hypothetical protein QYF36_025975 [Acer negundo]
MAEPTQSILTKSTRFIFKRQQKNPTESTQTLSPSQLSPLSSPTQSSTSANSGVVASTLQFLLHLQIHRDSRQPPSRATKITGNKQVFEIEEQVFEIDEQGFVMDSRRNHDWIRVEVLIHLLSHLLHSCLFCCRRRCAMSTATRGYMRCRDESREMRNEKRGVMWVLDNLKELISKFSLIIFMAQPLTKYTYPFSADSGFCSHVLPCISQALIGSVTNCCIDQNAKFPVLVVKKP